MAMAVTMVIVVVVVLAREWLVAEVLLAVEDEEVHPERVEGRHEHAGDDGEVGELPAAGSVLACTASMIESLE